MLISYRCNDNPTSNDAFKLLGSIFPEKVEYDGKNYRTNSYNKMLEYIYQNSKQLQGKRKESDLKNHSQSHLGCPVGL